MKCLSNLENLPSHPVRKTTHRGKYAVYSPKQRAEVGKYASDKKLLAEFGGHITLTKAWSHSLLSRMGWVKRRGSSTEKPHIPEDVFQKLKNEYLERVKGYAEEHSVHLNTLSTWITQGSTSPLLEDGLWSRKVRRKSPSSTLMIGVRSLPSLQVSPFYGLTEVPFKPVTRVTPTHSKQGAVRTTLSYPITYWIFRTTDNNTKSNGTLYTLQHLINAVHDNATYGHRENGDSYSKSSHQENCTYRKGSTKFRYENILDAPTKSRNCTPPLPLSTGALFCMLTVLPSI